jgi:hypothetical protein
MRKLFLIALIALAPTSSCYANLSLASNEALSLASDGVAQTIVEQPKLQHKEGAFPSQQSVAQAPRVRRHAAIKRSTISRPGPVNQSEQNRRIQGTYGHCF